MAIKGVDPAGTAAKEALRRLQEQSDLKEQSESTEQEPGVDAAAEERRRAAEAGAAGAGASEGVAEGDPGVASGESSEVGASAGAESPSGEELHQEAVETAGAQQDRGEDWQRFSETDEAGEIPPDVEAQARETAEDRERDQKVKVADLLKEQAIDSGKIPS